MQLPLFFCPIASQDFKCLESWIDAVSAGSTTIVREAGGARTFGSAAYAGYWHALWIYFVAPTIGMLVAATVFLRARHGTRPYCAKLQHANNKRCIFRHDP